MRKLFTVIAMSVFAFWTLAQTKFYVFMKDGSEVEFNISDVDSIGFQKRSTVVNPITPENKVCEYVDLGLSSGTLWATCNIGASSPEGYGNYFAWGETTPYIDSTTYLKNDYEKYFQSCFNLKKLGVVSNDSNLVSKYDAATAIWGDDWRMPTGTEMRELLSECKYKFTTLKGVSVIEYTGPNGNKIYFPAAGYRKFSGLSDVDESYYYWTSTLVDNNLYAESLIFEDYYDEPEVGGNNRDLGAPIRPVMKNKGVVSKAKTSIVVKAGKIYRVTNNCDGSYFEFDVISTSGSIAQNDQKVVIRIENESYELTDNRPYLNDYDFGLKPVNIGDAIPGDYLVFALGWANATENYTLESPTLNNVMTNGCEHVFEEIGTISASVGTANGHVYVDLGLPSGNKWATCNVGASKSYEWGNYYAWGDTVTKQEYTYTNCATIGKTYEQLNLLGYTDKGVLIKEYDAAFQNWGDNWKMPSRDDFQELINNCTWTWTSFGNVEGYEVKSNAEGNNNSIFLPTSGSKDLYDLRCRGIQGWYWTSTAFSSNDYSSWCLVFTKEEGLMLTPLSRRSGFSVRPIYVEP